MTRPFRVAHILSFIVSMFTRWERMFYHHFSSKKTKTNYQNKKCLCSYCHSKSASALHDVRGPAHASRGFSNRSPCKAGAKSLRMGCTLNPCLDSRHKNHGRSGSRKYSLGRLRFPSCSPAGIRKPDGGLATCSFACVVYQQIMSCTSHRT